MLRLTRILICMCVIGVGLALLVQSETNSILRPLTAAEAEQVIAGQTMSSSICAGQKSSLEVDNNGNPVFNGCTEKNSSGKYKCPTQVQNAVFNGVGNSKPNNATCAYDYYGVTLTCGPFVRSAPKCN